MELFETGSAEALVEAVLFMESEPAGLPLLAKATGLSKKEVEDAIYLIQSKLASSERGVELFWVDGGYLLMPKRVLWQRLRATYGGEDKKRLSKSAMETLSIIAYTQPVTKGQIEGIRGVSADRMLKVLLEKNLIKVIGGRRVPGRPTQFGTTKEFLMTFQLNSISELPRLDNINIERFLQGNEAK